MYLLTYLLNISVLSITLSIEVGQTPPGRVWEAFVREGTCPRGTCLGGAFVLPSYITPRAGFRWFKPVKLMMYYWTLGT